MKLSVVGSTYQPGPVLETAEGPVEVLGVLTFQMSNGDEISVHLADIIDYEIDVDLANINDENNLYRQN